MKTVSRALTFVGLSLFIAGTAIPDASGGTFKHITVDGSFEDWAGVPVAATDEEGDMVEGTPGGFDLREVYVANDEQYVYLRVVIYASSTNANYSQFHHHFYIDSDNDPATGHAAYGLGSEMLIEDAGGYSERYGTFNDGEMTGLGWSQAPAGGLPEFQYEARFSRAVRDVQPADVPVGSGNPERDLPLFTQDAISMAFEIVNADWAISDAGTSFPYELAPAPPVLSGTQTLVGLTDANWRVNDSGSDPGAEWLAMTYDDSQSGWKEGTGLFGFNAPAGVYPAPLNTVLETGPSTYYFRTHFTWDHDQNGAGLLLSNYLSAGAVFYLNGVEVTRIRMPEGPVTHTTRATGGPAQPGVAELVHLPATALVVGDNLLQVEVHPVAGEPSSLVFGAALIASDNFPPFIQDATQPADRTVVEGESTTLSAGVVTGTQPFTYQWLKDGTPIPEATNAVLTLDPVTLADAGQYLVEVTNPKGLKASSRSAVLSTTAVEVALADPNLPADQVIAEGTSATFTVAATGTLLSYQWQRDGEPIPGQNGPELVLTNVALSESGTKYWVVVSNRLNSVSSRQATLTVARDSTPPTISAVSGGGRKVVVTFSEPLDQATAQQASKYQLDGGAQVQSAVLDSEDERVVTLSTDQQGFGQVYALTVAGVEDRFGNAAAGSAKFRSTISIDGSFEDWAGVPVALTQEQFNPGTVEFNELSITNDNEFLYIRFSFFAPAGPLSPSDWTARAQHWDIIIDTDQDPTTGTWSGGDLLLEDAAGDAGLYRLAGSWTQGTYTGGNIALAPGETPATEFELRVARNARHETDGLIALPNPAVAVFMVLQTMGWTVLDQTTPPALYTFMEFPPLAVTPGPLSIRLVDSKVEITWPGTGVLETRASLSAGEWTAVEGAVTGIQIDPASAPGGFYRLRQTQ